MDVDADEDEEESADEDSSGGFIPPTSEPSWAKRLKNKKKVLSPLHVAVSMASRNQ